MDRLESYLDQICRSIGGPRSLRQHVRQELREHLLDAVAQHRSEGLSEETALETALEEFGKPEDVRSELEATHGQRMMALVIDKAMQWKEKTMKAKWLWMTWAYVGLVLVLALEVLFITFNVVFIIPKYQKIKHDGMIDISLEQGLEWMSTFLNRLSYTLGHFTTFLLLGTAAVWGLFEWRVHSENKPFMRLAALGTAAVGLMVVVFLTAGSLVILFEMGMPALGPMTRPWAVEQVTTINTSLRGLEQALEQKDWKVVQEQADQTANALNRLSSGPALYSLTRWNEQPNVEELRAELKSARESFLKSQQAIRERDAGQVEAALRTFRKSYEPVLEAAKRPAR